MEGFLPLEELRPGGHLGKGLRTGGSHLGAGLRVLEAFPNPNIYSSVRHGRAESRSETLLTPMRMFQKTTKTDPATPSVGQSWEQRERPVWLVGMQAVQALGKAVYVFLNQGKHPATPFPGIAPGEGKVCFL